jgi:flagellar biosynthesis GTPase FlhF
MPVAPLEMRGRREGALRGLISRLLGGRFAASTMLKPSPPRPIDAAAAAAVASRLAARGASEGWIAQLITTAGAHGVALADSLEAAVEAEIARRIVPAPALPVTGAAVAFIGAGGSGKTRCTAALASAYRRASTLGVTVITIDGRGGERELRRLLDGEGVPVLAMRGEQAQRAVASARDAGFVIVDTPTTTPTDPAAIDSLAASLAALELDGIYVTLPATLGPQAARRALTSFGQLNPSAVAITHADETDQLAVIVEIAISHRIPLGYFHSGTDHLNALSAVEAAELAQQLLAT